MDEYRVFWTAFMDLLSEPRGRNDMIPWTAIRLYSNDVTVPVDDLKAVIWALDSQLRAWWKANPQQADT